MATYAGPVERLELYERLVAYTPEIERKGATMPYTSRNGHMFSFLDPDGSMAIRLAPDAREEFVRLYSTALAVSMGTPWRNTSSCRTTSSNGPMSCGPGLSAAMTGSVP